MIYIDEDPRNAAGDQNNESKTTSKVRQQQKQRSSPCEECQEVKKLLSKGDTNIDSLIEQFDLFRGSTMTCLLAAVDYFSKAAKAESKITAIAMEAWDLREINPYGMEQLLMRWEKFGKTLGTFPKLKELFISGFSRNGLRLDYQAIRCVLRNATRVTKFEIDFGYQYQDWDAFSSCLNANKSLTSIQLDGIKIYDTRSPIATLATLPNLREIILKGVSQSEALQVRPPSRYLSDLLTLPSLRRLEIDNVEGLFLKCQDYEAIGSALGKHTCITSLSLQVRATGEAAISAAPICDGLATNTSLTELTLSLRSMDEVFYESMGEALSTNAYLQTLRLNGHFEDETQSDWLVPLLRSVQDSSSLLALEISGRFVFTPMVSIAFRKCIEMNTHLQFLSFPTSNMDDSAWHEVIPSLRKNMVLKQLDICWDFNRISEDRYSILIDALSSNYFLQKLTVACFGLSEDQKQEIETITSLNEAGRSYLVSDASSKTKGVKLLTQVKDKIDCSYRHLLENPLLCDLSSNFNTSCSRRKRKRRD